jgi:pyruvate-formate lyase-activating enzyme
MTENLNKIKEQAALERRQWVRLTRACNNRCLFCHDVGSHDDSRLVPDQVIRADLERGRAEGATRLILSGGEPTIHPLFLDYIALGRSLGYTWVQCISNGRMFAYPAFARRAVALGLREATFSVHGHTPEMHDHLVGIPGAFEQVLAAIRTLTAIRGFVLSIDVVLNRLNLPHLADMLECFIGLGVREFDLLHLIPFGRAWGEHRDELYYDVREMAPHLKRAFEVRRRHDVVIWTNRLPPEHLEGEEDLIQDPHKLHDEVHGRLALLQACAREGTRLECAGERCAHCHLSDFCERFDEAVRRAREGGAGAVRDASKAYPTFETLSQAEEQSPPLDEALRARRPDDLPVCLGGSGRDTWAGVFERSVLDDAARYVDPVRFADHYVRHLYRRKSLRCVECTLFDGCPGLHINHLRRLGFGVLHPIKEP